MRTYAFQQVDVFTDTPLAGNPLAVFPDAAGLTDDDMQAIAREMNLSETSFVFPSPVEDPWPLVRIFSPTQELPFAGHPTIGTAYVLATLGRFPANATEITLHEKVGPISVTFEGDPARPAFAWMTSPPVRFEPPIADRLGIAEAVGLELDDRLGGGSGPPIQVGSTGNRFLYVPLRDRAATEGVVIDSRRLATVLAAVRPGAESPLIGVFLFNPEEAHAAEHVGGAYSRMIAPSPAEGEDPATGSASGPLAVYLVREGLHAGGRAAPGMIRLLSEQGTKMLRQSFVHLAIDLDAVGAVTEVRIGGSTAPVIEGVLRLPEHRFG